MRDDIQVSLKSDPKLLSAVRGLVRGYMLQAGFAKDKAEEVVLAVDEACTNAIRHAYRGRKNNELTLILASSPAWVSFEVNDNGIPAPIERLAPKPVEAPDPKRLKPHGLGVQLMYRVFDEVCFSVGLDGGNNVLMRLRRPKP